ncbi:tetratricopeptide repeat protein [bacterium]|nr:tetratricopeptide repeat protein [bacterium]
MKDFNEISNYFLIEPIYKTSISKIYLARSKDPNSKQISKVKILGSDIQTKIPFIQDISENIHVCKNLSHNNVVKINESFDAKKNYHYVTEYVFGKNLTEIVNKCKEVKRNITSEQALNIISKLCNAAIYIKNYSLQNKWDGFSFCSFTPSQILFSYEGDIKLSFPSIAGILHHRYKTRIIDFSDELSFYSPDYLRTYSNNDKTIIFSLGSLMYYILYGKPAIRGDSLDEIENSIASISPQSLFNDRSIELIPEIEEIIITALNINPTKNFKILEDFARDIQSYISLDTTSTTFNLSYFMYDIFYEEAQKELNLIEQIEGLKLPASSESKTFDAEITDESAGIEELVNLGLDNYGRGEVATAIDCWEKVLAINPEHPKALEYLSIAREDSVEVDDKEKTKVKGKPEKNGVSEKSDSTKDRSKESTAGWVSYIPPIIPEVKLPKREEPIKEKPHKLDSAFLLLQENMTSFAANIREKYNFLLKKFNINTPIFLLVLLIVIALVITLFYHFQPTFEEKISNLEKSVKIAEGAKDFEKASKIYDEMLIKDPANPRYLYNLGLIYIQMGRISRAEDLLKRTVELQPDNVKARFQLIDIYSSMGAYSNALQHLDMVLKLAPQNIKALVKKAGIYAGINENIKAARIYVQLGELHISQKNNDEAFECFKKAIELDPGSEEKGKAYLLLGNILYDQGKFIEAEDAYRNGISYNYGLPELHYQLGLTRFNLNNFEEALNSFSEAWVVSNNKMTEALFYKGLIFKNLGDLTEAENTFKESLTYKPDNPQVLKELGTIYFKKNDIEAAKTYWGKALAADPNIQDVHFNFGFLYHKEKEYENAIAEYQNELLVNNSDPKVYANMGMAYIGLKEYSKAIESFSKSLELQPEQAWVYVEMGKAYSELGNNNKAIEMLELSLDLKPDQPEIKKLLGRLKK